MINSDTIGNQDDGKAGVKQRENDDVAGALN
jgi:hypothetical protein